VKRGEIWWASLGVPTGSEPGYRRPVVVLQSDAFNESRIGTVIVAAITTNTRLADAPGNIALSRRQSDLPKDSVVNVSQILTLDKSFLTGKVSRLSATQLAEVEQGVRLVLAL
jgi:mRNA interferase MazF